MFGTYLRLNLRATASDTDVVRATRRKFVKSMRRPRKYRETRHQVYRLMLAHHARANALFHAVATGDFDGACTLSEGNV